MCSLILGRRIRKSRSVRIKGQTLTIEGHNGEEDMMGRVTWLPLQELIKGWTDSEVEGVNRNERVNNPESGIRYRGYGYNQILDPYKGSRENSQGRRMEMRSGFDSRGRENMNLSCYNCGRQGHMVRDCRESKCFECGKFGHIAPYCPGKREKLRCAGCGRFGHNKEECNTGNFDTKGGFTPRGMGQNTTNVRTIGSEKIAKIMVPKIEETKEQKMECFRCRKMGHVARECGNL
ncbi:CCHC-type zinc finger nucleic acid binding protein-like [Gordionus sp. m RMFG-2023]|uniref:CCHC-type zinc finger nucleic acid binding protein-like n=1 Tax=Gordionus sp. m RMFG-2023 TaxID=3053472 RepID=UPI0031FDDC1D